MGGGSKSTTTTTVTQTEEEKEFTRQQIELAKQQLKLTEEQHGWQSEIYALTKPLLERYGLMVEQEFADYNTPEAQALRGKYKNLESAELDARIRQLPIQEELLQRQLDEIRRGGRATDEQKALIGEIANRAIESGDSDIGNFLHRGLRDIRNELAPARGMRPDDAPMIDEGENLAMEALRQKGLLTSNIRGAQANAELNFPLNAAQMTSGMNQWQQNFGANMSQYLAGIRQNAVQNRAQLMGQLFTAPMAAGEQGIGLINASRPTPVSFPRNTTETTKQSGGGSILGGIGGFLSGVGQVAGIFSSEKAKQNIRPIQAPPGELLSPGALKFNVTPVSGPYRTLDGGGTQNSRSVTNNLSDLELNQNDLGSGRNLRNLRDAGDFNDPWAIVGNRWQPDSVADPVQTGPMKVGALPAVDMESLRRAVANKQQPPEGGYRPGYNPDSPEGVLRRVASTPVSTWEYKPETGLGGERHIGPMAEHFNTRVMGKGPKPTISTVDAIGSLMSSVQALEQRTRQPRWRGMRMAGPHRNRRVA